MSPQEIALLSDAVKIGLPVLGTIFGAAIGACSTYVLTKLNQKHDVSKERTKRRFELLTQAATDVTEFEHLIGRFATEVSNCVHGRKRDQEVKEALQELLTKNQPIRRARMTLKLLGLNDSDKHLEEYIELTREVVKTGTGMTKERVQEVLPIIVSGPVKFYSSLSDELR